MADPTKHPEDAGSETHTCIAAFNPATTDAQKPSCLACAKLFRNGEHPLFPSTRPEDADSETARAYEFVQRLSKGGLVPMASMISLTIEIDKRDARIRSEHPDRARIRAEALEEAASLVSAKSLGCPNVDFVRLYNALANEIRALAKKGT